MSKYLIYCLIDPRDGEIRYTGQSSVGMVRPKKRHSGHCWSWEESLKKEGLKPIVRIIQECETLKMLNDCEIYWIAKLRNEGCRLTNLTDGGEGIKNPFDSTRQKMRLAKLGKKRGPRPNWVKKKISDSHQGKSLGDYHRLRLSESHRHSVKCVDDGMIFSSLKDAGQYYGVTSTAICSAIKNDRKCINRRFEKL